VKPGLLNVLRFEQIFFVLISYSSIRILGGIGIGVSEKSGAFEGFK
jgi:hypothetical protein